MKALVACCGFLFLSYFAVAQMRIIPHVTRAGGGFTTQVIIANTGTEALEYDFVPYDAQGNTMDRQVGAAAAQTTLFIDSDQLFNGQDISHFGITDHPDLKVSLAYQRIGDNTGPAQINETNLQSPSWRLYPGNPAVTWDGIALVNTGDAATDVTVRHFDGGGRLLGEEQVFQGLAPLAKGLRVLSDIFDQAADSYYEVVATQPTAITALRGNLAFTFLWGNAALAVDPTPVGLTQYTAVDAFPRIFLDGPLDIQSPPGETSRLFVVGRAGVIRILENDPDVGGVTDFLDISDRVSLGGENGLLSMAFHPDYADNGYFYVHYTTPGPNRSRFSRFRVSDENADRADPAGEFILLEVEQPQPNHNGGQIVFGPDGYLYMGLGDGGGGGDPFQNGQDPGTLLGSILRIDVDNPAGGMNYGIPADNPFAGNGQGIREEIFAYGLRNPWKLSFGLAGGETRLWVADVGQDEIEEIDLIESGKNYGWNTMEGSQCFSPAVGCDAAGLEPPLFEYNHDQGDKSISGGLVYQGSRFPELRGAYIYADFVSGRVWALFYDGVNPPENHQLLDASIRRFVGFGVDPNGELILLDLGGKFYRLDRL